jgi:hypothetical protein
MEPKEMTKPLRSLLAATLLSAAIPATAADFGAPMPEGEAIGIAAAADPSAVTGTPALYSGRITEVCQKQGCWLVLEQDGHSARVMVKDHAFAVPTDATGDAVVYGVLEAVAVDADEAEHLAADGAAAPAESELRIVATAVRVL